MKSSKSKQKDTVWAKANPLPDRWSLESFSNVVEINSNALSANTPDDYSFYYLSLSDVNSGVINHPVEKTSFKSAPERARRIIKQGDILLSTVRPNLQGFGYVDFNGDDYVCSTGFAVLRPKTYVTGQYLYQFLFSHQVTKYFYSCVVGSNYPAINNGDIERISIPLPPIDEQINISQILSTWDRAIERTQRLIEAKQRQKKGLMQGLLTGKLRFLEFGEPVHREEDIPIGWKKNRLREFVTFHNGFGFPKLDQGNLVGDIPFIKVSDMLNPGNHKFIFTSNNYVPSETMKLKGWKTAPASAIIFAKVGEALYKNRRRILTQDTIIDNNVMAIKAIPQKIDDHYLYYVMLLVNFSKIAFPGALPSVNQTELGNVHIILPDLSEQRKIIAFLDRKDTEIDFIKNKLALLQQQKKGLMQKLLTGEIRVKVD